MKLDVIITHAAFDPERVKKVEVLREELIRQGARDVAVLASNTREHARTWAMRAWRLASDELSMGDSDGVIILNDDVDVPSYFLKACEAACVVAWKSLGGEQKLVAPDFAHYLERDPPISLHVQVPEAIDLWKQGRPFARSYSYTGPGVILKPSHARSLLAFAEAHPEIWTHQNEDGMANVWAWDRQIPFWLTIPALVKHDTSIASTLGYDNQPMRTASVDWTAGEVDDLTDPRSWQMAEAPPWLPHPWMTESTLQAMRKLGARRAQSSSTTPKVHRVVIGSITRGNPAPEYTETLTSLLHASIVDPHCNWSIHPQRFNRNDCIVHARSSVLRDFLDTDGTHLFLVDDDQSFKPNVLHRMVNAGHDFVCAPYPRREGIDFERVRSMGSIAPAADAFAYQHSVTLVGGNTTVEPDELDDNGCAEIESIGLGCALLSRSMVERMTAHYAEELGYHDPRAALRPTVALFQPVFVDVPFVNPSTGETKVGRILCGEDVSFCRRWRAMGGKVQMYLGPGSPIDHVGRHVYRGHLEVFGLSTSPEVVEAAAKARADLNEGGAT